MMSLTKGGAVFTDSGFRQWKKALAKDNRFCKHELSHCHKEAPTKCCDIPSSVKGDVGEMISTQRALEKYNNRKILLKILGNVPYLAREALPL